MALPELLKKRVDITLGKYCKDKVPSHVQDKVQIIYEYYGDTAILIETRVPRDGSDRPWTKCKVAKFKFDRTNKNWILYYFDRNSKAHEFPCEHSTNFSNLLDVVEEDATGIFWG